MAVDSYKFPAGCVVFVSLSLLLSVASSQEAGSVCTDGTYRHDGRECCLCGAGLSVAEHCTTTLQYGKCEPCPSGRYSSHPNDQESCERCTSCSHPNENLEEDIPCTPARDAKCRCKKDHYCVSGTETCKLCHPCKECGAEGVKVLCAGHNNTICNVKVEGGNVGTIVGVLAVVAVVAIIAVAVYFWKRRQLSAKRQEASDPQMNGDTTVVEMQPLRDVGLQPHLHDIAEAIGWKVMHKVALRSEIPKSVIESCQQNHPGDAQEQTVQLLQNWEERHGKGAARALIQHLQNSGNKGTAEKVDIILRQNLPG